MCSIFDDPQIYDTLLRKIRDNDSSLWRLDVRARSIGDAGAIILADALRHNTMVTNVMLYLNNIGISGISAIAAVLKNNNQTIVSLELNENDIGIDGGRAIADMLLENTSLREINLLSTNIQSCGAKAIAMAIKQTKTTNKLSSLNLCNNHIDDEGILAFADMLVDNETLNELYLECNNPTTISIEAIAVSLRNNETLKKLSLWNENITVDGKGADMMWETLREWNDTIKSLYFPSSSENTSGGATEEIIEGLLEENFAGNRIAPRKAERRRRIVFDGLWETWMHRGGISK